MAVLLSSVVAALPGPAKAPPGCRVVTVGFVRGTRGAIPRSQHSLLGAAAERGKWEQALVGSLPPRGLYFLAWAPFNTAHHRPIYIGTAQLVQVKQDSIQFDADVVRLDFKHYLTAEERERERERKAALSARWSLVLFRRGTSADTCRLEDTNSHHPCHLIRDKCHHRSQRVSLAISLSALRVRKRVGAS